MRHPTQTDSAAVALLVIALLIVGFIYNLAYPCKAYGEKEVYRQVCHGEAVRVCTGGWEKDRVCLER